MGVFMGEMTTVIELLSCFSLSNTKETQAIHRLLPLSVGRDVNTSDHLQTSEEPLLDHQSVDRTQVL